MSQPLKFLYVEDNDGDVLLLQQALEERHVAVDMQVISEFDSALRFLTVKATHRDAPPPNAILLDWHIPRGDGGALMRFIMSDDVLRKIPTFLFTGRDCHKQVPDMDPNRCVEKPSSWDGMLALADTITAAVHDHERRKVS